MWAKAALRKATYRDNLAAIGRFLLYRQVPGI